MRAHFLVIPIRRSAESRNGCEATAGLSNLSDAIGVSFPGAGADCSDGLPLRTSPDRDDKLSERGSGRNGSRLEKQILERGLKRPTARGADRKARADCTLLRAKYFDIGPLAFLEFGPDRAGGEFG